MSLLTREQADQRLARLVMGRVEQLGGVLTESVELVPVWNAGFGVYASMRTVGFTAFRCVVPACVRLVRIDRLRPMCAPHWWRLPRAHRAAWEHLVVDVERPDRERLLSDVEAAMFNHLGGRQKTA